MRKKKKATDWEKIVVEDTSGCYLKYLKKAYYSTIRTQTTQLKYKTQNNLCEILKIKQISEYLKKPNSQT